VDLTTGAGFEAKLDGIDAVIDVTNAATVLRATQFHEFAAQMLARRGPLVIAPKTLCQPHPHLDAWLDQQAG
jgi:hypothetical protein